MNVTFHLHTPPPKAVAGSIPAQFEPSEPIPYIRIDGGVDQHTGRTQQVVSRAATPEDTKRYRRAWAQFQSELQAAAKAKEAAPARASAPAHPRKGEAK